MGGIKKAQATGTKTLLVCRICNSTHGSKEDHAIKTHLQLRDFLRMKEGATFPITVKYEGVQGNYKVLGKWQNKTLTQILNFEHAPLVRKKLDEYAATKQSWSFQIHGKAPSRKTLYKALLRTAYLTCFSKWGYDFFAANLLLCRRTLLYIVK